MYCSCHEVLAMRWAVRHIIDEVVEFVVAPSKDEASDIVYAVNRLFGSLLRREYVRVIPGDRLHVTKILGRMEEYGCIRSRAQMAAK